MYVTNIILSMLAGSTGLSSAGAVEIPELDKNATSPTLRDDGLPGHSCLEVAPRSPRPIKISKSLKHKITFEISHHHHGGPCTLVAKFPSCYPIKSRGIDQVNVRAVGGPAPGALVGTLYFRSAPNMDTVTFVNSFACRDKMSYALELASEDKRGFVAFEQDNDVGLFMEVSDQC